MQNKAAMSVSELAEQLGISKPKAYELVKRSDFPSIKLGKRIVIPVSAFQDWLNKNAQKNERNVTRKNSAHDIEKQK